MKAHPLYRARLLIGTAVAVTMIYGFLAPGWPGAGLAEPMSAGQVVPAFLRIIAYGLSGPGLVAAALILTHAFLTAVFGRLYCAGLCPLGTVQAAFGAAWKKRRLRYGREALVVRLAVLGTCVLGVGVGVLVPLVLLDPYSIFGRSMHDLALPVAAVASNAVTAALRPLGIYLAPLTHSLDHTRITLFFLTALAVGGLAVSCRKGRPFCNSLCPAGTLLRLAAVRPVVGLSVLEERCTECRGCERVCPASCIDVAAARIDEGRCLRCFACIGACPESAIVYRRRGSPRRVSPVGPADEDRRRVLAGGLGLLAAGIGSVLRPVGSAADDRPPARPSFASPPGSLGVARFAASCTACHLCVTRCPTGVLRPRLSAHGPTSFLQPAMDFHSGFCEYECARCMAACPTGALLKLGLERKKLTQIGRARLMKERCIVFTKETACGACAEVCPTHAAHMVPYKPLLTAPATDDALCIGCGNCEFTCPVELKAIVVDPIAVHRVIDDRKATRPPVASPASPGAAPPPIFPF